MTTARAVQVVMFSATFSAKQYDLYDETFRPLVEAVLQGYNGKLLLM